MRPYGDGSAGELRIGRHPLGTGFAQLNRQFTNVTIEARFVASAYSGTIIRCTGDFVNDGTLDVHHISGGGFTGDEFVDEDSTTFLYQPPHPGWSLRLPCNGEVADNHGAATGGFGGTSLRPEGQARNLLWPGMFGGGAGANSRGGAGGYGGGALVILAQGKFVNNGVIRANGVYGSGNAGSGAGGIIVIAARSTIENAGTIEARGADSRTTVGIPMGAWGSGGAGGGGIVHLIGRRVLAAGGSVNVSGGTPGSVARATSAARHVAGGGGGACGGNGGNGGDVPAGDPTTPRPGTIGGIGLVLIDELDPTELF